MDQVFLAWKASLRNLSNHYNVTRGSVRRFFPKLFLFFIFLNITCYWLAMFSAFPEMMQGSSAAYYFKIQFPVGLLGALFDSFSFFVTIGIIRRALVSQSHIEYVSHLFLDLVIAILATFWVLFVFSFSGWLINLLESTPRALAARNATYQSMLVDAVAFPTKNLRNIYFGFLMGVSAMIPTLIHIFMFMRASLRTLLRY